MQGWSTPDDFRSQLERKWKSGQILAASIHGESMFPMRIPLKHPTAGEIGNRFDEVRRWITTLSGQCKRETGNGFSLEWQERNYQQLGKNRLPVAAIIESEQDALTIIGKQKQAKQFKTLADSTITVFPQLGDWLQKRSLLALKHAQDWPQL